MPGPRKLPSREEIRSWREFIAITQALGSLLTARLQSDTGLSPADYAVLVTLSEAADHRVRPSELAARIGWQRSRLSHHLRRMERRGLVRREECVTDSRGAEVVLEPAGATAYRAATVPHLTAVRELFLDALTAEQLVAVDGIAATLRAHLAQMTAAQRPD